MYLSLPFRTGLSLHELFVFVRNDELFLLCKHTNRVYVSLRLKYRSLMNELLFISPVACGRLNEKVINGSRSCTHSRSNTDPQSSATQHRHECALPGGHLTYLLLFSDTTGKCMNEMNNEAISKLINVPRTHTLIEHRNFFYPSTQHGMFPGSESSLHHFHSGYFHFHHSPSHWRFSHFALTVMH